MELMRLQVAALLPPTAVEAIVQHQQEIRRRAMGAELRPIPAKDLVVTVSNLGDIPLSKVKTIETMLEAGFARVPSFPCGISGLTAIPNPTQPKAVAVNLVGETEFLVKLQGMLAAALQTILGPNEANREWQPHIVIARLKADTEGARTGLGRAIKAAPFEESYQFTVKEMHLLETKTDSMGTSLMSRASFPLIPPTA